MSRKRTVAGLAAVLVATGCGAQEPAVRAPALLESVDLRLPLDDYLLSPADLRELGVARAVLVRECMSAAGLALPAADESVDTGVRTWNERRYGVTDVALAASEGYGLGRRDPAARPPAPRPQLTDAQRGALEGPGGCAARAEAEQRRESPAGVDRDLPRRLATDSFTRSRATPAVRAAVTEWSTCLAERGFHYDDPLAPAADDRFAGGPDPTELAAATADVECKRRTNLVGVWFAEERAIQLDLVAANRTALDAVRRANTAELAVSRRLTRP